ncbi:hypothetical protein CPB86DRAFT_784224, partial [Serendipita vermifera]
MRLPAIQNLLVHLVATLGYASTLVDDGSLSAHEKFWRAFQAFKRTIFEVFSYGRHGNAGLLGCKNNFGNVDNKSRQGRGLTNWQNFCVATM